MSSICERFPQIFLAFSGGRDSVVLAHMLEPWKDRVTLVWVNTGEMFPHMVEWVRSFGERFTLVELPSNLADHWQARGIPATVLMGDAMVPGSGALRMQPWRFCCYTARTLPLLTYLQTQPGPWALVHGQRNDDADAIGLGLNNAAPDLPAGNEVIAFYAGLGWGAKDVADYVTANNLTLPMQYPEIEDLLECWCCPAYLDVKRVDFMRRHYPLLLDRAVGIARPVSVEPLIAVRELADALRHADALSEVR